MDRFVLVSAPSGVALGDAVRKLEKRLDAETADIEEEIKSNPETEAALAKIGTTYVKPINMETVTRNLPRLTVSELWKKAIARCLKRLEDSGKPVKLLSGHLTYYSSKRSEFYSVVDFLALSGKDNLRNKLQLGKVLLLIDDIYDMYARLQELYSVDLIESLIRSLDIDVQNVSKQALARVTMGWQTRNLLHLLSWRNMEPITAENLARQLGADFLIWPVKQLTEAVEKWLKSEASPIYLSHPITQARREMKSSGGKWPEFTQQVNEFQRSFAAHEITIVMPTGIDEYRFEVKSQPSRDGPQFTGRLDPRWPNVGKPDQMLYSKPSDAGNLDELLLPKYYDPAKRRLVALNKSRLDSELRSEIHAYCQVLVSEIDSQISSRDFLIVYYADGLLVFRPYYSTKPRPDFAHGVAEEVRLWREIVQLGDKTRRIVFVHFSSDVKSMISAKSTEIQKDLVDAVWDLLQQIATLPRDIVDGLIKNQGRIAQTQEILNKAEIAPRDREKLEKAFPDYLEKAKISLLKEYLTNGVNVEDGLVAIWVIRDSLSLQAEMSKIAQFFRTGSPQGNDWEGTLTGLVRS
jgi:hypothetical protein